MDGDSLKRLLENVKEGRLDVEEALAELKKLPFEGLGFHCRHHG